MRRALCLAFAVASLAAGVSIAEAHSRSISHAQARLRDDGATLGLRLRALDVEALRAAGLSDPESLAAHLQRSLRVSAAGAPCTPREGSFVELSAPEGFRRWEWRVRCDGRPDAVAGVPVPQVAGHVCLIRAGWEGGGPGEELVLSERGPSAPLPDDAASGSPAFARFVPLGIEHILTGFDHLAFLAMLLLVAGSLRETAGMVTGFTVGHSVTLAAAALGAVRPDAGAVEALIGLSVAVVAAENVWLRGDHGARAIPLAAVGLAAAVTLVTRHPAFLGVTLFTGCYFALVSRSEQPVRWRWALAGLFGLLHGFGFAGVLGEAGLEGTDAAGALLGFNLGVELGQLALVALLWPALAWLRRRGDDRPHAAVVRVGSALGAAAGTFWLVTRALG